MRCDRHSGQCKEIGLVIDELEARARGRLPLGAAVGARARAAEVLNGHEIEVVYRIDRKSRRVINYFYDGARMARETLLMLLCTETACPQAQALRRRWRSFIGQPERAAPSRAVPLSPAPLMVEVAIEGAGHRCVARPASFECLTPCPVRAHAPQVMHKSGWDLFEDGIWVAGGLCVDNHEGACRPRFESTADAQQWLATHQARTLALFDRCR
jgi:hypothetical protein